MFFEKSLFQNMLRFCIEFAAIFSWFVDYFGIMFNTFSASIFVSIFASIFYRVRLQNGSNNHALGAHFRPKKPPQNMINPCGKHPEADPAPQDAKKHSKIHCCRFSMDFGSFKWPHL